MSEIRIDPKFDELALRNFLDTWVIPEVKARIERGELPNPYPLTSLRGFQILFYPDGRKCEVRLNDEIRAHAKITSKPGVEIKKGQEVTFDHLDSPTMEIFLTEEERDCGHATFLHLPSGGWTGYFDFIHYKGTSEKHLHAANQFLSAARDCRKRMDWIAFADTLFSAAELAAKATLFYYGSSEKTAKSKTHTTLKSQFNLQHAVGNVSAEHTQAFNLLSDLRKPARYLQKAITFKESEADELLQSIANLIGKVLELVQPPR